MLLDCNRGYIYGVTQTVQGNLNVTFVTHNIHEANMTLSWAHLQLNGDNNNAINFVMVRFYVSPFPLPPPFPSPSLSLSLPHSSV